VAVLIEIEEQNGKRDLILNGTGFFVTSNGYILTCYHVIHPPRLPSNSKVTSIKVEIQKGTFEASHVADKSRSEKHLDWAVLKVNENIDFPCLSLLAEHNQGDHWCSIGYERAERAKGYPLMGTIIGPYERKEEDSWDIDLKSENPIQGGVSGSPVFNKNTNCVAGLIKEVFEGTQVFATSIDSVFKVWPELKSLNSDSHPLIIIKPTKATIKLGLKIPHQISSAPLDFTGRDEELRILINYFNREKAIVGIRGLGGTGKTALAFKLAEMLMDRYPDGQIMVDLKGISENPLSPADAMAQVIRSFDPTFLPQNETETTNTYRSVLNDKRVLLLLDNAFDDKQVRPLLPPSTYGLIITSRKKFAVSGMNVMDLEVLKPSDARELLIKICNRIGNHADELAKLCGYLPLALKAAGSFMANTYDKKPAEYIDELRLERTRLERLGSEGVDLDVASSFNLSYSRLHADFASVFRMASIFPADFSSEAEEAVCQDGGHKGLSELVKWGLIDYRSLERMDRYRMHDLARAFASGCLDKKDGEAKRFEVSQRFAEYYGNLLNYADSLYQQGGENILAGLRLFDLEWPNIQASQAWSAEKAANIEDISELSPENKSILRLCSSYFDAGASVLNLRLHPLERIRWLETGLGAARKLNDRGSEGAALGNLGLAYYSLGDYPKAIQYQEQSLAIAREIGNRLGEGQSLGNLGLAYDSLGDYPKAIQYQEQRLAIAREIGDRLGEGNALFNMSLALYETGKKEQSIGNAKSALQIYEQIESPNAEAVRQRLKEWLG
jgi:tetratricopeptide (TPR) repeat protein